MALTKVKLIADGVITSANLDASHGITTSDIGEGSNLYYTDSRVSSYLSTNGFATQTDIVAAITDSAPVTLDTLNELAAALGDDPNFATTTATSLGLKAPLASPSFTGNATFAGSVTLSQNGTNFEHGYAGNGLVLSHYGVGPSNAIVSGGASNPDTLFINNGGSASDWSNVSITGNVGINETSPASDLVVRADSAGGRGGEITILNYASNAIGNEAALNFGLENSTYAGNDGNAQIKAIITNSSAGADLVFTNWSGSAFTERMRISSSGDVSLNGGDIFLNSGTNYNDKGVVYLSNERTAIISDIVNLTANGDTSLDFQTRSAGTRASSMFIDEFRNVGIGTTSPSSRLQVKDSQDSSFDSGIGIIRSASSQTGYINMVGGAFNFNAPSGVPIRFRDGGTANVTIDGSGKVGVSNTNPSAFNSLGATAQIVIGTSSNFVSNLTTFSDASGYGSIAFADSNSSSSTSQYSGLIQYYHADNSMTLYTSAQPRMRITSGGNISINYNNQNIYTYGGGAYSGKLIVKADSTSDVALACINRNTSGSTGGNEAVSIAFVNEFVANQYNWLGKITLAPTDSWTGTASTRDADMIFSTNGDGTQAERMRIKSNGNVGIGTTVANGKLHIADTSSSSTTQYFSAASNTATYSYITHTDNTVNTARLKIGGVYGYNTPVDAIEIFNGRVGINGLPTTDTAQLYSTTPGSSQIESGLRIINPYGFASAGTGARLAFAQDRSTSENYEMAAIQSEQTIANTSTDGDLVFLTRGSNSVTEKMRILSSGGITFNGDTTANNALDDYEEGTWTPDIHGSTTRGTVTYQHRSGSYTKIGNRVWCRFGFKLSSISGATGRVRVDGLPFSHRSIGSYQEPNFSVSTGLLATTDNAYKARMFVVNNSSYLEGRISVNSDTIWNISDFGGDEWIILAFHYETHI